MSDYQYVGSELDLFAAAHNWKEYWIEQIRPFVTGDVLEVGAGIGSNVRFFDVTEAGRWVCLEPDPALTAKLAKTLEETEHRRSLETICGTIEAVGDQLFDTIIYIDVLEHIEDDRGELEKAALRLRPNGHLIVLSPAHQFLYSPFDSAIGHFRRYNRAMIRQISPASLHMVWMRYLDCVGMILSAANMMLLRQSMPTASQLSFWNNWVIPPSRFLDKCIGYNLGKTIIAIWRRD